MNAQSDESAARSASGFGSRIASDSFVYGLGGIANQAVAILLVPIYAQVLGPPGVGVTGVLNSVISLALMLVGLALPQAFFRWYLREAEAPADRAHVLELPPVGELRPILDHAIPELAAAQNDRHAQHPSRPLAPKIFSINRRLRAKRRANAASPARRNAPPKTRPADPPPEAPPAARRSWRRRASARWR